MNSFFDCFQVAGLGLFLTLFLGRTLHLRIERRVNAITFVSTKKGLQRFIELTVFVGVNVWAAEVLLYALDLGFRMFPSPLDWTVIDSLPARLLGVGLVALAFVIFIRALVDLGNSWRLGIDEENPGELVTNGIYALSRHPIYLFFDLYFIGTFFINGTLTFVLLAVLLGLNLHFQMLQEEAFLVRIYGSVYQRYCARTARYLGRRRRLLDRDRAETPTS